MWKNRTNPIDLTEFDRFFSSVFSVAKQELQRRGVQDLTRAMTAAESLVEFKKVDKPDSSKSKGKGGGDRDKCKGKEKDKQSKEGSEKPSYRPWRSNAHPHSHTI